MSQETSDAVKIALERLLEWAGRLIQALLLAATLWAASEIVALKTSLATLGARLEAASQLAGVNLLSAGDRMKEVAARIDRLQNHIEAVDGRVRDLERGR